MGGLIEQFLRFGAVGVLNTLLDFSLFNLLTGKFRWPKIRANLVSASVAMTFSFLANGQWVFPGAEGFLAERAVKFILVTATSGWLVQNVVIRLLDAWSLRWLNAHCAVTSHGTRVAFFQRNLLKAAAVGTGMLWNFSWYRLWVFA
jgi:putative flippase GtrA